MHMNYVYTEAPDTKLVDLVMDLIDYSNTRKVGKVYKHGWNQEKVVPSKAMEVKISQNGDLSSWDLRKYRV